MITDKMSASLLLAQKLMCWVPFDVLNLAEPLIKPPHSGVLARIRQFNSADTYLYKHFSKRLDSLINRDPLFSIQLAQVKACEADLHQRCEGIAVLAEEDHLAWAKARTVWPKNGQCPAIVSPTDRTPTELVDECRPLFLTAEQLEPLHRATSVAKAL
jgi:hypothetical protein